MLTNILTLFGSAMLAGLAALFLTKPQEQFFKNALAFSGAYLFSVTMVHIMPELFEHASHSHIELPVFMLVGFFLQIILQFFSSGAEHGHIHSHGHEHSWRNVSFLMVSLGVHAILEGTLLMHPASTHTHHENESLLIGVVLHKLPEAFAFMAILLQYLPKRRFAIMLLLIFALFSPAGVLLSNLFFENLLSENAIHILFALVAGNFLHIATTIFFENSPEHRLHPLRLAAMLMGAGLAVFMEVYK